MNFINRFISSTIAQGVRLITINRLGKHDPAPFVEIAPYGIDSQPIQGTQAAMGPTVSSTTPGICYGYMNTGQVASAGECRMYSTDSSGALKYNVWVRADGSVLFGTSAEPGDYINHVAQYEALNTGLQSTLTDINNQLTAIETAINALAPGTFPILPVDITLDITAAKLENIKTQ